MNTTLMPMPISAASKVTSINDGWAMQQEIAATLGVGTSTVRRWQRRYDAMGIRGLERKKRQSPPLKMRGTRDKTVRRLFAVRYRVAGA